MLVQDEACMHSSPRGAIGSSQELQTEEPPAWGSLPCQGKALQSWVEGKKKIIWFKNKAEAGHLWQGKHWLPHQPVQHPRKSFCHP